MLCNQSDGVRHLLHDLGRRDDAEAQLRRCLDEFVVDGIDSTIPLFRDLVDNQDIANGMYDIHWLEKYLSEDGTN